MEMQKMCGMLRALVAAVLCLTAFDAGLAAAAPETAGSADRQRAAALLEQGKYDAAYEAFMRLLRENPDDDAVHLYLGRSAMRAGRYNQAVMAYERLLEKYPAESSLYGELAHAYMALGDRGSAQRALAAAGTLKDASGQKAGENLLDSLEKRYSHWQAHGQVRTGILYDSNANLGPASSSMDLGIWRVEVPDAKAESTLGAYLGANADLAWKAERDTPWWLVGDVWAQARGNSNSALEDSHSRTSLWGRAAVGLRHLTSTTLFDLRFKSEVFDYEWYQNITAVGPEAAWIWAVTPQWQLISRGSLNARMYSRADERNGAYWSVGQHVRRFFGQENHEIVLGVSHVGAETPRHRDYGYHGWEFAARALFKLPVGFELAPFAAYEYDWYHGPGTALETDARNDHKWRLGAALTWNITEAWAVEAMYQYTCNASNSAIYTYDQSLVSLGVAWSF